MYPHLTLASDGEKRDLLRKFITLDPEAFLMYLHPLLTETQWDRVQEEWPQSLILYGEGGTGKTHTIEEMTRTAHEYTDNLNLIIQQEKKGLIQVYTYGAPKENRFVFVRNSWQEAKSLSEELGGSAILVQFMKDLSM